MFAVLGALVALWLTVWLARRGRRSQAPEPHAFTRAEIAGYSTALPKYLLASAICLLLGGIHGVAMQLPAVRQWLAQAGEAALLVDDEVSEQLLVVGGAVLLTMGLTCYALPRLIGRPLRNHTLARLSFALTFGGALLTALLTGAVGLLEGIYIHSGATLAQARAELAPWERGALWLFAGVRDAGYWTFALLVLLTVLSGRHVIWPQHRRRLTNWLVVSAGAFFLVVCQRLVGQLPENPLLQHGADEARLLVSYQGYIHLHLFTATLVPVAAAGFVYLLERRAERRTDWHLAYRLLGSLALAGTAFYLSRLGLGLYEAYLPLRYGLTAEQAAQSVQSWRPWLLGLTGLAMLLALAGYALHAARLARSARGYLPRAIVGTLTVSLGLAFLAGLHGAILATLPPGEPSASSQAHGILALGSTLLLPALTLADCLLIDAAGAGLTATLSHAGLAFLGAGIVLAYLAGLGLGGPAAHLAASGLQLAGFIAFALHALHATGRYREALRVRLRFVRPARAARPGAALLELQRSQVLLIEFLAALVGFPGFGWLFGGFALTGALLLYIGPGIAWALIPSLFALSQGWLHRLNWGILLLYLPASALTSTLALHTLLRRRELGEAG